MSLNCSNLSEQAAAHLRALAQHIDRILLQGCRHLVTRQVAQEEHVRL